ncbi:MAG: hypothetical protein H7138_27975 [Myxococcales bacterium]|nr:hypothetical protein [Myxococcales bacterium]
MNPVIFLVTQQGCQIHIQGRGKGRGTNPSPSLVPIGKVGDKVEDQPGALTLDGPAIHVPAGTYRVAGSSAFRPVGDGVIIYYDAEDPPVPVPGVAPRFAGAQDPPVPVPALVPGFASTEDLDRALYHYVDGLSK